MFTTLRRRFILSHILPFLVILPLMGIVLVYVLETNLIIQNLASELQGEAILIGVMSRDYPEIWENPTMAQNFVSSMSGLVQTRIMILDSKGIIMASSDPLDANRTGEPAQSQAISMASTGEIITLTSYNQRMQNEVVDVFVPILHESSGTLGYIRLTHRLADVYQRFLSLRYIILGVVFGGIIMGGLLGYMSAITVERPIKKVSQAVCDIASGAKTKNIKEEGPEETKTLIHSVNILVDRMNVLATSRKQLLANLVHEIGRPLGALRSASDALLGGASRDKDLQEELLLGMRSEVDRLGRLLDDLSRLYDQVIGSLELNIKPVNIHDWLINALAPLREDAQTKGLTLVYSIPRDLPEINIDPDRMGQALGNLVNNAIKYVYPQGRIEIGAGVRGGELWMRISDNGPGIPQEEQQKIFEAFYRYQTGARFPQGMGLGLSISNDVVKAHGGRIELRSEPGKGSHFTIWLPLVPKELG
jgi:two-component system sensor histidine kinase BaeS